MDDIWMYVCIWIYDIWMIYRCNLIYAMMIEVKISNNDDNDEDVSDSSCASGFDDYELRIR